MGHALAFLPSTVSPPLDISEVVPLVSPAREIDCGCKLIGAGRVGWRSRSTPPASLLGERSLDDNWEGHGGGELHTLWRS